MNAGAERAALEAWIESGGREVELRDPSPADVIVAGDGSELFEAVVEGRLRLVMPMGDVPGGRAFRIASPPSRVVEGLVSGTASLRDAMGRARVSFAVKRPDGAARMRDATARDAPAWDGFDAGGARRRKASETDGVEAAACAWAASVRSARRGGLTAEGACDEADSPSAIAFRILSGGACLSSVVFTKGADGRWDSRIEDCGA